jgi:hypothetical protein
MRGNLSTKPLIHNASYGFLHRGYAIEVMRFPSQLYVQLTIAYEPLWCVEWPVRTGHIPLTDRFGEGFACGLCSMLQKADHAGCASGWDEMDFNLSALSAGDVVQLALSTGVVTTIINQGVSYLREWQKDRKATNRGASYTALRLSIIMESFALACANSISQQALYHDSGGSAGSLYGKLPMLGDFPVDAEWKALNQALAARALALPIEISGANDGIASFTEMVGPDDNAQFFGEQSSKVGLRAWKLALDMRKEYRLPALDLNEFGWEPIKILNDEFMESKRRAEE